MANPLKTLHLCGVLFWLIAIQTGPVASERQMVDKVVSVVNCFMCNIGFMQYSSIVLFRKTGFHGFFFLNGTV